MPPVVDSDANSSFGVVRKSYHHHGRGMALMIVPSVSCGGIEKPLRLSRSRAPATGVSTVNISVSNPASAARRASPYEISRSRMTYSWNQLRPCGFAALTSSIDVVPRVERVNGMPAAAAADAPAISPSVCMSRVKPVGAMPNGSALGPAEDLDRGVDIGRGAQDAGVELDVLERLPRPGERQLALGRAVGVVERGLRGAALRDLRGGRRS